VRFGCRDKVIWKSAFTRFASLDPGFGGDPCCFRTFKRGEILTREHQEGIPDNFSPYKSTVKIECDETIYIPINANDKNTPPEYQIAYAVMNYCKARMIPPDEFIIGSTGTGRGAAAVLQREWSPRILECDESGACSSMIVSNENPRPAKELYDRKVTELWMNVREFAEAGMLKGLDNLTCRQLCSRKILVKGTGQGKRQAIEKKEEMLKSPNDADALAFALDLVRGKGIFPSVQSSTQVQSQNAPANREESFDFDSSKEAYSDPLLDSALEEYADF
jgi:hypothetical protein